MELKVNKICMTWIIYSSIRIIIWAVPFGYIKAPLKITQWNIKIHIYLTLQTVLCILHKHKIWITVKLWVAHKHEKQLWWSILAFRTKLLSPLQWAFFSKREGFQQIISLLMRWTAKCCLQNELYWATSFWMNLRSISIYTHTHTHTHSEKHRITQHS